MDGVIPPKQKRSKWVVHIKQSALLTSSQRNEKRSFSFLLFKLRFWIKRQVIKLMKLYYKHQLASRIGAGFAACLIIFSIGYEIYSVRYNFSKYELSAQAEQLLTPTNKMYGSKLSYNSKDQQYIYNGEYRSSSEVAGMVSGPKFTATLSTTPSKGVTINDVINNVNVTLVPKYNLDTPIQKVNRVIYPITGMKAAKVYTLRAGSMKEDIVIEKFAQQTMDFKYGLQLPEGTIASMETNGDICVYGIDSFLLGNISAGTDKDKELLTKARANGKKTKLLFTIPAPIIYDANKKESNARATYDLNDNVITVHATQLDRANYPISIDPSVYIESAAKLMRGNNESNIAYDISNELLQKGKTSGARINGWSDSTEMNSGVWDQAMAAAGGYVYRAGGRQDPTMPYVTGQQATIGAVASSSYVVNMPTIRPAGDLYVILIAHKGTGAVTPPSGWTEYADIREHAAYYKVGTDQGGGSEASTYTFTGSSAQWAGVVLRVKGFDPATPISGTAGTGSSASAVVPVFPTMTPSHDATLVIRAAGINAAQPTQFGWLPSGHTELYTGTSSTDTANSAALITATLDVPPAASGATGTSTVINDGNMSNTYGASSIAIKPAAVTAGVQTSVQWAKFDTTSSAIDSPNPGNGTCTGWCNDSVYNLPAGRVGMQMVAYNGFLYAMGGTDGSTRASTVYIAKLGANGEPQLWHPSGGTPVYWYTDTGLNGGTARSYFGAVAYNNRMYVLGGQTNASAGGVTTVEEADINPTGTLGSWTTTGMQVLPDVRHSHAVQMYNDTMYLIGGNSNGTLRNTVYYSKINSDGTMNPWVQTNSFTTARSSFGGSMTGLWGAYIYIAGGCSALTSGYCSTLASDVQLASINADGSIAEWNYATTLSNQRMGYTLMAWQNGLYRFGGCNRQNTSTGACYAVHQDSEFGVINQDGDASTVSNSVPNGTAPCNGTSPYNCDLPPVGDAAGTGGLMSSQVVINNGFIYNIGGCTDVSDTVECDQGTKMSGNISYAQLSSTGTIVSPPTCGGTQVGSWCVDITHRVNSTLGIGAAGSTVFNNTIYIVGGTIGDNWDTNVWRTTLNADGSINTWTSQIFSGIGLGTHGIGYSYVFARANPSAAASNPGNLYVLGGCIGTGGIQCATYYSDVYKCNITTTGALAGCTTTGQLQIDSDNINTGAQALGLMAGAVYANRVYLAGGACPVVGTNADAPCGANYNNNRRDVIYASIDNSNNIVASSGSTWQFTSHQINPVRQRAVAFGYNGYLYSLAGYNSTGSLRDLIFAKIDVSTGDLGPFSSSGIVVTQRWDLRAVVSNGYVYALGGCGVGSAPTGCTSMQAQIQTFQLYNNDSGAPATFTAASDDTFATDTDRWGASAAILNGYVYVAGGCTSTTDCTTASSNVQKAAISATDGSIGTWSDTTAGLPAVRTWGSLQVAGGSLYYLGGQDSTATNEQSTVYYATPSSGDITTWSTATKAIGDTGSGGQARTKFGASVWNNRIYVVGGLDGSAAVSSTVYVSPQLNSGGDITSNWTSSTAFNVARSGLAVTAYANNLYVFGGTNGTQYFNDSQYAQIASNGTVGSWAYSSHTPSTLSNAVAFAANGYMYLIGGRSATSTCAPNTIVAPISANTTIASGNNPTGLGEWYETNTKYQGGRYGAAVAYAAGKAYIMGGGCTSPQAGTYSTGTIAQTTNTITGSGTNWTDNYVGGTITYADASTAIIINVASTTSMTVTVSKTVTAGGTYTISMPRHSYVNFKSQPQIAKYSRMIDTDTDVFPTKWLLNGLDNSTGANWYLRYRSSTAATGAWGQETVYGKVTLGTPDTFTPKDSGGTNTNYARYYYLSINIDSSQAFGYPEDVTRGPTIADLSLFFTADPSKRLRHGKTFTGGELQPLDTPF